MNLPTRLKISRRFLDSLNLSEIEQAVAQEARAQLVIVGPVNSGKSTLFNQLKGQKLSAVSAVPGTTREAVAEQFGPFWLVDTPGFGEVDALDRADTARRALDHADVVVLVLDASAGVRQDDADLYRELRARGHIVVVALNKIDLLSKKQDYQSVLRDAEAKLRTPVIPISAKKGTNIARDLMPKIIDAHPRMAIVVGRALPQFRRRAARRVVREASAVASLIGAEPIPGLDVPLLIVNHVRMLLRLAAIYGEKMTAGRARELIAAIAGGALVRYGAQEAVKFIVGPGWLIAGVASGTGTWALGQASIVFFEAEQALSETELRELYRDFRRSRPLRRLLRRGGRDDDSLDAENLP